MIASRLRTSVGLAALLAATLAPSAHAGYTFTSFDGPPDNGGGTTVNGINNAGQIVGFSANAAGTVDTNFVRDAGGSFTLLTGLTSPLAQANGINSGKTTVGVDGTNAFVRTGNGTVTDLNAPNPGNTASEIAFGINDGGTIVGQYVDTSTNTTPGFIFDSTNFTIYNPTAGALVTNVQGINNNGLAVGFYSGADGIQHGFAYDTKSKTTSLINDPFQNLVLTQFLGINDHNQAVGYYQDQTNSQHGFLYDLSSHTYYFLDAPGAALIGTKSITQITGIANTGEIAGFFVDANGLQRGFLANGTVPEPSSVAMLGIGLASALTYARRRRKSAA